MSIFLVLILTIFHYFRFLSKNLLLKWDVELLLYYRNHFHVKQLSFEVVKCVMTSSILKIPMVLKNNYTKKILYLFAILKVIRAFVPITRSSHQKCSIEIVVLKNFTKFTGKQLCQSLFFNNVADLRPAILLKRRFWHRCFPVSFVKFFITSFYRTPPDYCFYIKLTLVNWFVLWMMSPVSVWCEYWVLNVIF